MCSHDFKPNCRYFEKVVLSPDLWANNNKKKKAPYLSSNQKSLFELSGGMTLMVIC